MRDNSVRTIRWIVIAAICLAAPTVSSAFTISIDPDSTAIVDSLRVSDWEKGSKDIVRMGQDIDIKADETIEGDVVAIGGRVTIAGKVLGDAVSVGGGIHLLPGSVVNGDVVTVGGKLDREAGATVLGQNVSVGPAGALGWIPHMGHRRFHEEEGAGIRIGKDFLQCLVFFVIGMIIFFAFPKRMGVVRESIRTRFWLSLVVGFGSLIGVTAALVLLTITCIGIFVAVPGAFIFILTVIGTTAVAVSLLGEAITRRPMTTRSSWVTSLLVGLAVFFAVGVLAELLRSSGGGFLYGLGQTIRVIQKTAWAALMMVGFGSFMLTRLGSRTMVAQPWTYPPSGAATPPPPPNPGA